jgi:hypothetical protein
LATPQRIGADLIHVISARLARADRGLDHLDLVGVNDVLVATAAHAMKGCSIKGNAAMRSAIVQDQSNMLCQFPWRSIQRSASQCHIPSTANIVARATAKRDAPSSSTGTSANTTATTTIQH